MRCEQSQPLLPLLALDELDAVRKVEVESHLAGCPACRTKLGDLRAALDLLNEAAEALPSDKLSAGRRQALSGAASRPPSKPRLFRFSFDSARWREWVASKDSTRTVIKVAAATVLLFVGAVLIMAQFAQRRGPIGGPNPPQWFLDQVAAREEAQRKLCNSNLGSLVKASTSVQEPNGDFFPESSKFGTGSATRPLSGGALRSPEPTAPVAAAPAAVARRPDRAEGDKGGVFSRLFGGQEMRLGGSSPDYVDQWEFKDRRESASRPATGRSDGTESDRRAQVGKDAISFEPGSAFKPLGAPPAPEKQAAEKKAFAMNYSRRSGEYDKWEQTTAGLPPPSEPKAKADEVLARAKAPAATPPPPSAPVAGPVAQKPAAPGVAGGTMAGQVEADRRSGYSGGLIAAQRRTEPDAKAAQDRQTVVTGASKQVETKSKGERLFTSQMEAEKAATDERTPREQQKLGLFAEANAEFAKGKYESARDLAMRVAEMDPQDASARDLSENAREKVKEQAWSSIHQTDKRNREDERLKLRGKLVRPNAAVQSPRAADDSVYAQAAKDLLAQADSASKLTSNREGGQNVLYIDGHATWKEQNWVSNAPSGKDYSSKAWAADTDAYLWDKSAVAQPEKPLVPLTPPVRGDEPTRAPVFRAGPVNPWMMTAKEALSTFAVDVDTASYSIARNYILRGILPPAASVRMEEFVNAFDYNYPTQAQGVFNVHAEAGPSPFRPELTLLKIGVRARVLGRDAQKPAHLVFVVDTSGSMERADRLPLVKTGLKEVVNRLNPDDRVSLVSFNMHAMLVLETAPASDKARILQTVDSLRCGGSTNLYEGLDLGYQLAGRAFRSGGVNRVVLCSDGVANIGATEADVMLKGVENFRKQGVTLTAVGCGFGVYDDTFLERLADRGDGNYVFVDTEQEARRVFIEQMAAGLQAVALDAKIQVAFDPARVRRYRLIGFENRALAAEDFRNDAVGGGTVSSGPTSGQSVTALYEIELLPQAEGNESAHDLGTVFVRYRNAEAGKVEEISTRLSPDIVRSRTAQESPRFFLAASAAEFAEILRGSEHAKNGSFKQVAGTLAQAVAQLPLDARAQELLSLVRKADGLPRAQ